ncbi:MAG: GDCCVxC domain-containing (seleno)protein [Nitrospira sp.]
MDWIQPLQYTFHNRHIMGKDHRKGMDVIRQSVVTCPRCGANAQREMPTDACIVIFECDSCRVVLRPKSGDCCIFCSFANVQCPPVQLQQGGNDAP